MKSIIGLVIIVALFATSCSEVLIEDHIEGSWELQTYLRNDVDETSLMKIVNYVETYTMDGTFSRTYIDGKQEPKDDAGTFSINEDNSTIHISDVSSISEFSDEHSTLSTSTIDVELIDEMEYAYTFENGGDKHKFVFTRKE